MHSEENKVGPDSRPDLPHKQVKKIAQISIA